MAKGFRPAPKGNSASRRAAARTAAATEMPPVNPVAAAENEEKVNFFDRILQGAGNVTSDIGNRFAPIGRSLNTPMANMAGAGALGAGLSVLGNVVSGEIDDKGLGRVALEALGAGALGATAGGVLGGMNRDAGVANFMANQGISKTTPAGRKIQGYLQNQSNLGMYLNGIGDTVGQSAAMLGTATALGGLGGLVGGGLSDLVSTTGVSGFGSSNTASAKAGMQSTASTAYPADPTGGMSHEEMYLASLGYLPMS